MPHAGESTDGKKDHNNYYTVVVTATSLYIVIGLKLSVALVTPCTCAQQGQSARFVHLSSSLSSEGHVEGLVQNRSVRIQKILAST